MLRRHFLKSLGLLTGSFALPNVAYSLTNISQFKTLQISPIAGFQHYQGEKIWQQLAIGQPLQLIREADNKYDDHAVVVEWQGKKLGYIPRLDNAAISQLLDRGERLGAVIAKLQKSSNTWNRVELEVRWVI